MAEWWDGLTALNQTFYGIAAFFSVFFIWQMISAIMGIGGDEAGAEGGGDIDHGGDFDHDFDHDGDFDHGGDFHAADHDADTDAMHTAVAFKILSIRSIFSFCTLFSWSMALYLNAGLPAVQVIVYSLLWGLAGMFSVALLFFLFKKMTHTGNLSLSTAIGKPGTVYLDINENGIGEVRIPISGVVSYVKARSVGGKTLRAGTPIRVTRRVDKTIVEVKPIE